MIRTLLWFRQSVRPHLGLLAGGVFLTVVDTILSLAKPWPLKVVVDDVLKASGGRQHSPSVFDFIGDSPETVLATAVVMLLVIVGLSAVADYWATWQLQSAGQRIGNDIRERLFAHLQRLSLKYHGGQRVGDLTSRVTGDVDRVQDMLVQSLSVLMPNALLVIGMAAVMFAVDPAFAALALAVSPFMAVVIFRVTGSLKSASRRARRYGGKVAAATTESLGAIQVVQAFSLEQRSQRRFHKLNQASLFANLEAVRYQARLGPAVDLAGAVSTAVVFWFGAQRVLSGRLSLGLLLVFLSYISSLFKPIKQLSKLGYVTSRGTASAERIKTILQENPDVTDLPNARPAPVLNGQIDFENVWFSYGREAVLKGINLTIEPGEIVALVGVTGTGKSTLVSLIPRFFDPQQGVVRLDGTDVRDYTVESVRSQIALVLQESVLFGTTLWENVACGRPQATRPAVNRAVRLALVDEFADRLPEGLQTIVGERGVNLSGGQRQRVAIARAIVRDAPILILDEPTSALDAASEEVVLEALRNLMRGRTTVVIAHRLSTVRWADRVAVVSDGAIVEGGSHHDLLSRGGTYASLWQLQDKKVEHELATVQPEPHFPASRPPDGS
jgi:ATP-binding cassette, subfamily B, bacterial